MSDERTPDASPEEHPEERPTGQGRDDDPGAGEGDERTGRTIGERLDELLSVHREYEADEVDEDEPSGPYDPFAPPPEPESDADEDEDEDEEDDNGLPDAPLFALMRRLERQITAERIDRAWIFPPRRIEAGETAVVVVAAYDETDTSRRRVYAAHYTALEQNEEHRLAVDEYGTAPADRVGRLVEEVVDRIKDGPTGAPRSVRVEGDERRWHETLHELAEAYLEERQANRRLRP